MKAFVYSHGDPSVGIPGGYTEIDLDRDKLFTEERAWVREDLSKLFSNLWDFPDVRVYFEDEPEAEIFLTDEFVA